MDDNDVVRETSSNNYAARENLWDEAWPTTEQSEDAEPVVGLEPDNIDEELPFPDVAGTRDTIEAVRDAEPYVPATDPPVLPGGREAIHVATGFGTSPEEEAIRDVPLENDADIEDEVRLILQQDSLASKYPLDVGVDSGVVRVTGSVPSIEDAEHVISVVGELPGVVDVVDDTTIVPTAGG
jgi:BON domain